MLGFGCLGEFALAEWQGPAVAPPVPAPRRVRPEQLRRFAAPVVDRLLAGQLDQRVTLQVQSITQSAAGDEIVSWTDLHTCWAELVPNEHRFDCVRVRWSRAVAETLTVECRMVYRGRNYDIVDIREISRRAGIEFDVEETSD